MKVGLQQVTKLWCFLILVPRMEFFLGRFHKTEERSEHDCQQIKQKYLSFLCLRCQAQIYPFGAPRPLFFLVVQALMGRFPFCSLGSAVTSGHLHTQSRKIRWRSMQRPPLQSTYSLCTHGAHANAHDWRIYQTHSPSRASLYALGTNMRTHIPDVSEYGWRVWHVLHCSSPQSLAASSAMCTRSCQHLFIHMWIDEVPVHDVS